MTTNRTPCTRQKLVYSTGLTVLTVGLTVLTLILLRALTNRSRTSRTPEQCRSQPHVTPHGPHAPYLTLPPHGFPHGPHVDQGTPRSQPHAQLTHPPHAPPPPTGEEGVRPRQHHHQTPAQPHHRTNKETAMANNPSVIARPTESGFAGRFVWNDGAPEQRLPLLLHLHAGPFGRDVERMAAFLVDEHPAGWSQLGDDPTADTGWVGPAGAGVGETRFVCHCHGDRMGPEWLITEQTGDPDTDGWVYLLRPDGVEVWHPTPSGDAWRIEPVVPWLDDAPALAAAVEARPPAPDGGV